MSFEQTRHLIDRARAFHRDLAAFYHRMEGEVARERVKLLLEYLGRHEEKMERSLAEFERSSPGAVLDAWFKFTPEEEVQKDLQRLAIRPDATVTEVICMALRLDEHFLRLYRQAAAMAPDPEVKELFQGLYEDGKKERSRLVLNVFEPE